MSKNEALYLGFTCTDYHYPPLAYSATEQQHSSHWKRILQKLLTITVLINDLYIYSNNNDVYVLLMIVVVIVMEAHNSLC